MTRDCLVPRGPVTPCCCNKLLLRSKPTSPIGTISNKHLAYIHIPPGFTRIIFVVQQSPCLQLYCTIKTLLERALLNLKISILGVRMLWLINHCGAGGSTQRARVRSPVGTSFLDEVFRGFSSPVRRMSGSFRLTRSPNIIWPSL